MGGAYTDEADDEKDDRERSKAPQVEGTASERVEQFPRDDCTEGGETEASDRHLEGDGGGQAAVVQQTSASSLLHRTQSPHDTYAWIKKYVGVPPIELPQKGWAAKACKIKLAIENLSRDSSTHHANNLSPTKVSPLEAVEIGSSRLRFYLCLVGVYDHSHCLPMVRDVDAG